MYIEHVLKAEIKISQNFTLKFLDCVKIGMYMLCL